ncbi:blue copper protein-like [Triticum urartu]|nr:blue copper protein-like [Triticum urartu]
MELCRGQARWDEGDWWLPPVPPPQQHHPGAEYTTWASDKKIKVGDTLVFSYAGGAHNVAEVSAADYASRSAANVLSSDGSGATTIALKTAGKHYFICGVTGHCSNDMKLAVDDVAAATAASSPKASPTLDTPSTTPTSPSTPGATPKTPATVPAPPTKQSESGATGLRATTVAGLGIAGLVAAGRSLPPWSPGGVGRGRQQHPEPRARLAQEGRVGQDLGRPRWRYRRQPLTTLRVAAAVASVCAVVRE